MPCSYSDRPKGRRYNQVEKRIGCCDQTFCNINSTLTDDIDTLTAAINDLGIPISDTDFDGLDDLDEIGYGTDPTRIDTDNDNLIDAFEIKIGTDPLDDDSDDDGYYDGDEIMLGTDPLDALSFPDDGGGNGNETPQIPGYSTEYLFGFVVATIALGILLIKRGKSRNNI